MQIIKFKKVYCPPHAEKSYKNRTIHHIKFLFQISEKIIVMVALDCFEEQEINREGGGGGNEESLRKEGEFVMC